MSKLYISIPRPSVEEVAALREIQDGVTSDIWALRHLSLGELADKGLINVRTRVRPEATTEHVSLSSLGTLALAAYDAEHGEQERPDLTNEIKAVFDSKEVQDVLEEFAFNMRFKLEGLPLYGMRKIVSYAVTVALATERRIPLEVFKMTSEEWAVYASRLADAFAEAGKPVFVVNALDAATDKAGEDYPKPCPVCGKANVILSEHEFILHTANDGDEFCCPGRPQSLSTDKAGEGGS